MPQRKWAVFDERIKEKKIEKKNLGKRRCCVFKTPRARAMKKSVVVAIYKTSAFDDTIQQYIL